MKRCPYCAEEIKDEAVKCRYCGSMLERSTRVGEWYRSSRDHMLGGVCAGLAEQFGVPPAAVRAAFVILTLFGLWGVIVYAVLWVVMPLEPPGDELERQRRYPFDG